MSEGRASKPGRVVPPGGASSCSGWLSDRSAGAIGSPHIDDDKPLFSLALKPAPAPQNPLKKRFSKLLPGGPVPQLFIPLLI